MADLEKRVPAVEGDVVEGGPFGLEASIDEAVKGMHWLKASDMAAVKLAKTYASRIDKGMADFEEGLIDSTDLNKVLYLGPHILNTLRALGGTPAERKALLEGEQAPAGKLDELKRKREQKRKVG